MDLVIFIFRKQDKYQFLKLWINGLKNKWPHPSFSLTVCLKQQRQAHEEAGENLPCHKSQAFAIAEILNFSSIWSAVQWHYTNSKRKMLNYGCRSKHGNSTQSSHAIKCSAGCESQKKKSLGQKKSFLLALLLRDCSNIRVVTSNTTKVSQWKFLLCHRQHIKIKKFLKLSSAERRCMSAFQIL